MWPMKTLAIRRKEHGCLAAVLVPESSLLCVWLGSLTDPPVSDSLFECPQHCDAPGPWWAIVSDSSWAMNCPSSALWQQPYLSFRAQCMWVVGWGREVLPGMIAYPDIHPLRVPWTEGNSKPLTFPRSCSHSPLARQFTGNRKSRWLFQARDHWAKPPLRLTSPPSAEQRLAWRCTFKHQSEPARPGEVTSLVFSASSSHHTHTHTHTHTEFYQGWNLETGSQVNITYMRD